MNDAPLPRPHLVRIYAARAAYPSGTYDLEVLGFASPTREEAEREAALQIEKLKASPAYPPSQVSGWRVEHRLACDVCRVTGKKPGCSRKACEKCGGLGSVLA